MKKTQRNPKQLMLFGMGNNDGTEAAKGTTQTDLPTSDPNLWHRIVRITPAGKMEWAASYSSEFSAFYAMQLWYCHVNHLNFYNRPHLRRAREQIAIGKSGRTVSFEKGDDIYILTAKKGKSVLEGISGSKYEHEWRVP